MDKLSCLNETEEDSAKKIFKPWENRLDRTQVRKNYNAKMARLGKPQKKKNFSGPTTKAFTRWETD